MGKAGRFSLCVLGVLALGAVTLETGTRLLGSPKGGRSVYREISRDFEQLKQLRRDLSTCDRSSARYYEYFLFSAPPCETATVNVSDFFSARQTPASRPADQADLVVWTFGGSTMQEHQTTDERSIANVIAATIAAAGIGVRVENFGVPTFQSSLELIKFMTLAARVPADRLPDVVVFYDGYNDANHGFYFGAGNMQNDLSAKLAALIEHKAGTLFLYGASLGLADYSEFWRIHGHRRLERALFRDPDPRPDEANLHRAVEIYLRNTPDRERDLRRDRGALLFRAAAADRDQDAARPDRGAGDRGHEAVADRVRAALLPAGRRGDAGSPEFIDASAVLNGRPEDVFYDLGHVSAFGVPAVGELIGRAILARLREDAAPAGAAERGDLETAVQPRPTSPP